MFSNKLDAAKRIWPTRIMGAFHAAAPVMPVRGARTPARWDTALPVDRLREPASRMGQVGDGMDQRLPVNVREVRSLRSCATG